MKATIVRKDHNITQSQFDEKIKVYLMDNGAQRKLELLAQLPQVGKVAGPQRTVWIPGTPQKSMNKGVLVWDNQVSCRQGEIIKIKQEQKYGNFPDIIKAKYC